ncbi:MAG: hypothetical protein WAQ53_11355 [Thiofilum sp.]|uniref:hypothetical protein n=1 Tax=Thiofilum sp. TaxID=2212733 RepID=UPI0025FB71A2|nr:hypothetical protein [Thiofilum sp.]MBK8452650.1 hypothetical protein [Thiofilum sp.]
MMIKNNSYCLMTTALATGLGVASYSLAANWVMDYIESTPSIPNYIPPLSYETIAMNSVTNAQANIVLTAVTPANLSLAGERIAWTITALDGNTRGKVYTLQGVSQRFNLPQGLYKVVLTIGAYRSTKTIKVDHEHQQEERFMADVGRIVAKANEPVVWSIEPLEKGEPIRFSERSSISIIVGTGLYKVDASLKGLHRAERVRVNKGSQVVSELFIPAGRVNLIATRDNAPLFRPTTWSIYRIENGQRREVGEYNRHVQAVTMPPGHYEAVAKSENIVRSREFWVGSGATNDVQVSMD